MGSPASASEGVRGLSPPAGMLASLLASVGLGAGGPCEPAISGCLGCDGATRRCRPARRRPLPSAPPRGRVARHPGRHRVLLAVWGKYSHRTRAPGNSLPQGLPLPPTPPTFPASSHLQPRGGQCSSGLAPNRDEGWAGRSAPPLCPPSPPNPVRVRLLRPVSRRGLLRTTRRVRDGTLVGDETARVGWDGSSSRAPDRPWEAPL